VGVFTGGESMQGPPRLPASEFSVILKKAWAPFYQSTDVDRVYLNAWRVLRGISTFVSRAIAWAEEFAIASTLVLTVALVCVVRWFVPGIHLTDGAHENAIPMLLGAGCAVALAAFLLAGTQKAWRSLLPLLAMSGVAAVAATLMVQPVARLALLEIASVVTLLLVWRTGSRRTTGIYLTVIALSAASLIAGEVALQQGSGDWARALLLGGFLLKLAIVPLLLWLPALAEAVPALVIGVIIAVVDMAAFGELYLTAQAHPELLLPHELWIGAAIASSLLASLLMLTQRNIKRLLALSTIEDMGFLLLGVTVASQLGLRGALIGATVHALAKALLFISISAPEADGRLTEDAHGLASRYPVSAAGFLAGMLAMLGVPPLLGFAGRWRLYQTAAETSPWLLAAFVLCSMFALIAYVLCLTRCWWGPADERKTQSGGESLPLRFAIVGLIVVLLVGGLWPNALLALAGGVQ
jgi:multicomponent Na+:H+ antiporter subunit D